MLTTSVHPAPSVLAIFCALVFARPTARHNGGINGLQSVDCHHVAKKLLGQDIVKIVVLMAIVKAADLVGFADVRITELGTASTTKIAINFEEIDYN